MPSLHELAVAPRGRLTRGAVACVIILGVGLASHGAFVSAAFHYDDFHSLVENPSVRSLDNVWSFFRDARHFSEDPKSAMYRPVVLLTYALNYKVSGYDPAMFRLTNLAIHVCNSFLVFLVVGMMYERYFMGVAAGALFCLHPVNAEVVNYVSARSESLCALFCLSSFAIYAHARVSGSKVLQKVVCSLFLFVLALGAKSIAIVLPFVLAVFEASFPRGRTWRELLGLCVRLHSPYWGLIVVYLAATRELATAALLSHPVRDTITQLATQSKALIYYLKIIVLPNQLNVEHQFNLTRSFFEPVAALAVMAVLAAAYMSIRRKDRRIVLFWSAWFGFFLLPTIIIPLNVLINEHRVYLPMVSFAVLVSSFAVHMPNRMPVVWFGALLIIHGVLSRERMLVWQDAKSLWSDSLAKSPRMPRPHVYVADYFRASGRNDMALSHYKTAIEVHPDILTASDQVVVSNNLGSIHLSMGRFTEAVLWYQKALEIDPTYRRSKNALEALLAFDETVTNAEAQRLHKLGLRRLVDGRIEVAVNAFKSALQLENNPNTWLALGIAYRRLGNSVDALGAFRVLKVVGRGTEFVTTADQAIAEIKRGSLFVE